MKIRGIDFSRAELLRQLKKLLLVIVGTLTIAFGFAVFIIPFDLVTGGVTGIAIVIDNLLPEGILSVDIIIAILTWALFFVGLLVLGRDFALKTLVSTIVYPMGVSLFGLMLNEEFLDGFFYLQGSEHAQISLMLGALIGGACVGVGCALTFFGGGSTGGLDIIAFVICKHFKRIKSSTLIFILDATAVVLGMFVIGDLVITLLGILSAFVAALVIDRIFVGSSRAFTAEIVSEKYEEINSLIINELERTTTIMDAVGGYSGAQKKLMKVTFTIRQYSELLNIINKTDKRAFVTIHRAHEINGEGWTWNQGHTDKTTDSQEKTI